MSAYYNEHDPGAAEWLRELMKAGLIAPGDVDERSIEDVVPDELMGYRQCHFFAGIGVWSYALRLAGWPDDRAVWTGSCPCQPFSAAGKGAGFADERHLWPALHHLIRGCRPDTFFGEQVASRDGLGWLDTVLADLEGEAYAVRAVDLCVAGFGAPHIRQRLWFVADDQRKRVPHAGRGQAARAPRTLQGGVGKWEWVRADAVERGGAGWLDNVQPAQWWAERSIDGNTHRRHGFGGRDVAGELWYPELQGCEGRELSAERGGERAPGAASVEGELEHAARDGREERRPQSGGRGSVPIKRPGPTNGVWADADWLRCRDEWWRPVEAGTFPLAHGAPGRMGRLRGYGNAISPWPAKAFIEASQGWGGHI